MTTLYIAITTGTILLELFSWLHERLHELTCEIVQWDFEESLALRREAHSVDAGYL